MAKKAKTAKAGAGAQRRAAQRQERETRAKELPPAGPVAEPAFFYGFEVAWAKLALVRVLFFGLLALDALLQISHAPRYGAGGFNVAQLPGLDAIAPGRALMATTQLVEAYLFVLAALEFQQARLPERRHINGRELALAFRDLALDRFGVMARVVLEHWGITSTSDFGDVVFALVESELLLSQPGDRREDFFGVYAFEDAFEREYPWSGAAHA